MAGHSKWANIQHRKGRQDAKRGKIFTRLIKEITVAARMGGGDPAMNPRLRLAVDKATAENMPKDNIERAIKRGTGGLDGVSYEEIRYEGYGPSGAAVIVDTLTDNRTRTVAEVRHAFTKFGGNMGSEGSVAFLFKHVGQLLYAPGTSEDKLMEAALEAGAEDVVANDDGSLEVLTAPYEFSAVKAKLERAGFKAEIAEVTMKPGERDRHVGRGRYEDAEAPRRARVARRRAGRLHHGGLFAEASLSGHPHPRHRPGPGHHRLRRGREVGGPPGLPRERAHPLRRIDAACRPAEHDPRGTGRGDRELSSRRVRRRAGLRQREPAVDVASWAGAWRGDLRRGHRTAAGVRIHGAASEASGGGDGPRAQGAGTGDGEAASQARPGARRRRLRRPRVRHLPRPRRHGCDARARASCTAGGLRARGAGRLS